MDEKQKNKDTLQKLIILIMLLALVIMGIFAFYAYSKYMTTVKGSGTAEVAKWSFKVNKQTTSFEEIELAKTMDTHSNVALNKIAPGTSGKFDLELDGTDSEVAIDYVITMDLSKKPKNLILYRDSTYQNPVKITETGTGTITGFIPLDTTENTKKETETIYWKWPYETVGEDGTLQDEQDTKDSQISDMLITIAVTGTQRDPRISGLSQGAIKVEGTEDGIYEEEKEIAIKVKYSEDVYAGTNQETMTTSNAPTMDIKFGNGTAKQATCESVSGKTITYKYKIQSGDSGILQVASYTGTVYNKKGDSLSVATADNKIVGKNIEVK